MKKILLIVGLLGVGVCYADPQRMARDILDEIVHGAVNTDPDISEQIADEMAVLSLRAAVINLECNQKYLKQADKINKCVADVKPKIMVVGDLSSEAFDIGFKAASDQGQIHHEVKPSSYTKVSEYLVFYIDNLSKNYVKPIQN